MKKRFLLTSFETWLPHQRSNSSDDLLIELSKLNSISHNLNLLRLLPVDIELASSQVLERIAELQPDVIICCGMAESRLLLTVEFQARKTFIDGEENVLPTKVDLEQLVLGISSVEISHDCGKFVCEGLYYSVLDYLQQHHRQIPCIFVHVPILTRENLPIMLADFLLIVDGMATL
ncbi:peptidase C15 [Calothrix rhizosoleniae]|uniref:peptidase C15 n=1 Tax=Calothrix rhizosoleniae TaxID=888997 RepID=UPI000B49E600|nr:peptidase C15 [Calothrix rhizosoleniae]